MNPKTDKYMDFESLYGTAEGMVEILPVIPKKGWTPPNGIKLHQSKVRGKVRCIFCGNPRSFFSASRIKDRKLFTKGLEEIQFECKQVRPPGYRPIWADNRNNGSYPTKIGRVPNRNEMLVPHDPQMRIFVFH